MDSTMEQVIKDIIKLRKRANITQQEVSTLAGEPCRTFLAHLEQGRKTHLNLRKLHDVLKVLFHALGELPMDADVQQAIESLTQENEGLKKRVTDLELYNHKQYHLANPSPKKVGVPFEPEMDKLMSQYTKHNPVDIDVLMRQMFDTGKTFLGARGSELKIEKGADGVYGNSTIKSYVTHKCPDQASIDKMIPEEAAKVKFVKIKPTVYHRNEAHPWPGSPIPVVAPASPPPPPPIQLVSPVADSQLGILLGLTKEQTAYAQATFTKDNGLGRKSAVYQFKTLEIVKEHLEASGQTTRWEVQKALERLKHLPGMVLPDGELLNRFLDYVGSCRAFWITVRGEDRNISLSEDGYRGNDTTG